MRLSLLLLAACGATQAPLPPQASSTSGFLPDGRAVHLEVADGRITSVEAGEATGYLWPVVVDSHVHLAYWPVADQLASNGVGVAVDLAAPSVGRTDPMHVLASGPMLTRTEGYPLESWGSDGYGIGCDDEACVRAAVARNIDAGARVIKLALDGNGLWPALVPAAVEAAHARDVPVAAHALSDASALLAAQSGVDILAHTPVETLSPSTVEAWRDRVVVSTLAAFGGRETTIANLRALRAANATVLYGTDLGNRREAGPSDTEIQLLRDAGMDDAAITAAMTTAPLAYWKQPLAEFTAGAEATFLVLDEDPRTNASALVSPREVWLRGERLR